LAKQRSYERAWYARNSQKVMQKVKAQKRATVQWFKTLKSSLKCVQCGESDPVCLDFHHRDPGQKDFSLYQAARLAMGKNRILAEIAKCDVLCANCHRKLHRSA